MRVSQVVNALHSLAPPSLAESWDNVGLISGDSSAEVTAIAVCLDVLPQTVNRAIEKECNVLVSHHPLLFRPLKKLVSGSYVSDTLRLLVKNDINYIAAHTNLDFVTVSKVLCEKAGATFQRHLRPVEGASLSKLVVFVPQGHEGKVMNAMFNAGAGVIGDYDECSFSVSGEGTFRPGEGTNPFQGSQGKRETAGEKRIEMVVPSSVASAAINAARNAHPYEEMAYDIYPLANKDPRFGFGVVGTYDPPIGAREFIATLKKALRLEQVQVGSFDESWEIRKVAFAGGSAFECYRSAKSTGCDAFVVGEAKYHELFESLHDDMMTVVVGHGQSEYPATDHLADLLRQNFPDTDVHTIKPQYPTEMM